VKVEIENTDPEQTVIGGLVELSRKTGLIVRAVEPGTVERLFAEIEKYDCFDTAETLGLKCYAPTQFFSKSFEDREMSSSTYADQIMRDYYNSLVHGITGTPTTFINGELYAMSGVELLATIKASLNAPVRTQE